MKLLKRKIFFCFLVILDNLMWILINILPGCIILFFIRNRPWIYFFRLNLSKKTIRLLLNKRCKSNINFGSSCLSRAIISRIILDLCGYQNQLSIGITKNQKGIKEAHAWVSDPCTGYSYTPGIGKDGVLIMNF